MIHTGHFYSKRYSSSSWSVRWTILTLLSSVTLFSSVNAHIAQAQVGKKDIRISAVDFLIATDPSLAHYKGGPNPTIKRFLGEPLTGTRSASIPQTQKVAKSEVKHNEGDTPLKTWNSPPFFVKVGTMRFYGGLLTYGHELHPARICRVLNACIRNDGTVVLPAWMRRYDETLSFDCGIRRLEFSLTDTNAPPLLHNLDLFGSEIPPKSLHGFVSEFAPQLVALDMLSSDRDVSQGCHSRLGKGCRVFRRSELLRPAVVLHTDVDRQPSRTSWIKQFIRLIPSDRFKHRVRLLSQRDLFSMKSEDEVQCFRSAVLTRSPRTKFSINPEMLRELRLFRANSIIKIPRQVRSAGSTPTCEISVMFVNSKKPEGYKQVAGFIPNIWRLQHEIKQRAAKFHDLGLRVRVAAVTLDGKRLRYQIDAMQKSDIVVAGTSPYLADMMFMRDNSTVIEVMPFGYYPKDFEKLARFTANVRYDSYIAHPDVKSFKNCMQRVAPRWSANFSKAQHVMKRFKKVAAKYLISDNTHSYTLHNLRPELDFVKPCARVQRLNSNATMFATVIVHHARLQCKIGPRTLM